MKINNRIGLRKIDRYFIFFLSAVGYNGYSTNEYIKAKRTCSTKTEQQEHQERNQSKPNHRSYMLVFGSKIYYF